jgi:hypothetical protein
MSDTVCNDLDSEALDIDDRLVAALAVAHYAWQLKSLRDPAAIFLEIQINRQIHSFIIPLQRERTGHDAFTRAVRSGASLGQETDISGG